MRLTWLGAAALLIESGGAKLAVDPFPGLPERLTAPEDARFFAAPDILATHGHFDHILHIPAICRKSGANVYATETPCRTLMREGVSAKRLHEIAPGGALSIGPFRVKALAGRHCRFDAALMLRTALSPRFLRSLPEALRLLRLSRTYPEAGETLLYELSDGNTRLQLMGSLGLDASTEYPPGADWLILPLQGRSDLTRAAMPILERLRPRGVLLDHYDDAFPPVSSEIPTEGFCRAVTARFGIPCRALTKFETIDLDARPDERMTAPWVETKPEESAAGATDGTAGM